MSEVKVQRADPPAVGGQMEVIFAGAEPKGSYRVHLLLPSGESVYRKVTANAEGEVMFKHEAAAPALHVVELHEGPHDERVVIATAHVTPLTE